MIVIIACTLLRNRFIHEYRRRVGKMIDLFDAMLLAIALILILFFHRYVIAAILFTILAILYVCIYLPRRIWERITDVIRR